LVGDGGRRDRWPGVDLGGDSGRVTCSPLPRSPNRWTPAWPEGGGDSVLERLDDRIPAVSNPPGTTPAHANLKHGGGMAEIGGRQVSSARQATAVAGPALPLSA
jgi:hypothetical protein